MRLLHTGDWHLGRRLHGVDRRAEQQAALAEIAAIAAEEEVDAILVAGDLLERRVIESSPLSDCLDALDALGRVAPVVAVVGNHDDPALWERLAPYLAREGVHVAARALDPASAVTSIPTRAGPLHVACLPWLETGRLPIALGAEAKAARGSYADHARALVQAYADVVRERRASEGGVAVLLAHLMVDRARAGGGEREMSIGITYAISGEAIPPDLDYVALGHVHRAQVVPGLAAPGRYAGSPILLDFSDASTTPSVTLADVGRAAHDVRERPLASPRPLVWLRGRLEDVVAAAAAHERAYLHCEIEVDAAEPDLLDRVRSSVPGALRIEPRYPDGLGDGLREDDEDARDVPGLYREWRAEIGAPADAALLGAFDEALAAATEGRQDDETAPSG